MATITINSTHDYFVFGTCYTQNQTTEDSMNKLNLNPTTWTDTQILIRKGIHSYPSEIREWDSVKTLVKAGVITISEGATDDVNPNDLSAVKAVEKAEVLENEEKAETKRRNSKKKIMSDLGDSLLEKAMNENGNKD